MEKKYYEHVAAYAIRAVLYEVTTSPKPGLVDRYTNGAHSDMDIFTFMSSSSAISKGFLDIGEFTENYSGEVEGLLQGLRPIGMEIEAAMFEATQGVNTHKGIVFSLGLFIAAAVQVNKLKKPTAENISDYIKKMTVGLSRELINNGGAVGITHGKEIFNSYGFKGIRGEAEDGFPTVLKYGLDALKKSYYTLPSKNDLFVQTLFSIMTVCEDSNIVSRHKPETLYEVQAIAKKFLESGGMKQENAKKIVETMDEDFTKRNISPGGAADLLAVTIFLALIENIIT